MNKIYCKSFFLTFKYTQVLNTEILCSLLIEKWSNQQFQSMICLLSTMKVQTRRSWCNLIFNFGCERLSDIARECCFRYYFLKYPFLIIHQKTPMKKSEVDFYWRSTLNRGFTVVYFFFVYFGGKRRQTIA